MDAMKAEQQQCRRWIQFIGYTFFATANFAFLPVMPAYHREWAMEIEYLVVILAFVFSRYPQYKAWWAWQVLKIRPPGQAAPAAPDNALITTIATDVTTFMDPIQEVLPSLPDIQYRVSGQQRKISHKAPSDQTHIYFTDIPLPAPREMPVAHSNLIKVRPPTRAGQLMASMEIAIYYTKTWASPSLFSQNVRELLALGRAVRAARAGGDAAPVADQAAASPADDEDMEDADVVMPMAPMAANVGNIPFPEVLAGATGTLGPSYQAQPHHQVEDAALAGGFGPGLQLGPPGV